MTSFELVIDFRFIYQRFVRATGLENQKNNKKYFFEDRPVSI